ncbi:MAG TPA: pyridoxamine 5'-phosphate oxidase family protein [Bacteroidales bacterium]|nr:pyridoxamine 5'-phosphate oxidase family protein [Bacteroidales bacterium]HRZ78076.1 pyridoxamine 5'-phosphate oxidase family protein [Bacteroidales bacterium]
MQAQSITDTQEIRAIIGRCQVCTLGMVDLDGLPYVLPFNFGYDGEFLYLHSAPEGRKIGILRQRPEVCVSFSTDHELYHRHEPVACSYGMRYRSLLMYGKVEFIEGDEDKIYGLNLIMRQYTGRDDFNYNAPAVRNVTVFRVRITRIDGRSFGFRP